MFLISNPSTFLHTMGSMQYIDLTIGQHYHKYIDLTIVQHYNKYIDLTIGQHYHKSYGQDPVLLSTCCQIVA